MSKTALNMFLSTYKHGVVLLAVSHASTSIVFFFEEVWTYLLLLQFDLLKTVLWYAWRVWNISFIFYYNIS